MKIKNWICSISLAFIAGGCADSQRVTVEIVSQSGTPQFRVKRKGGNGLQGLTIWNAETREPLWDVSLNNFSGGTITYGMIPKGFKGLNGQIRDAVQTFPLEKKTPRPLPVKSRFYLVIDWQHDGFFGPGTSRFYFTFSTDEHGAISNILSIEHIEQSEFPNTP
jgi:hypothetical protein